jgi:ribosomal protein S18 acetylase RimI-like enzyme
LSQSPPDLGEAGGEITLRPVIDEDRAFLLSVYSSTRAEELSAVPWTDEQKGAFLRMQFDAQDSWYRQVYPEGKFLVIVRDSTPIGRLYVARLPTEVLLVDIALLPEHRGQGIGSRLLADVVADADRGGLPITLHVEPWNPAKRLYERLGFATTQQGQVYETMVRPARQLNTAS